MKSVAIVLLGAPYVAAVSVSPHFLNRTSLLQIVPMIDGGATDAYGIGDCRCVGIDNHDGKWDVDLQGAKFEYPAEAGGSCSAWEKDTHPECKKSSPPDWCAQKWCFVDPCKCNIAVLPKPTKTGASFHGKTAYWSYATCGGTDSYSADQTKEACPNQKSDKDCGKANGCSWHQNQCIAKELLEVCAEEVRGHHGQESCRCVGVSDREGTVKMLDGSKDDKLIEYPLDVGSTCGNWESSAHPDCQVAEGSSTKVPKWCAQSWCWVDPCKCKAKISECGESGHSECFVPPKVTVNKDLRFQGKHLYWSYETCGSGDSWSQAHKEKYCVTQPTQEKCAAMGDKCHWTGLECLGKELATMCNSGSNLRPMAVLLAVLAVLGLSA